MMVYGGDFSFILRDDAHLRASTFTFFFEVGCGGGVVRWLPWITRSVAFFPLVLVAIEIDYLALPTRTI